MGEEGMVGTGSGGRGKREGEKNGGRTGDRDLSGDTELSGGLQAGSCLYPP